MPNRTLLRAGLRATALIALALSLFAVGSPRPASAQNAPGSVPLAPPTPPPAASTGAPPILGVNDPRNPLHLTQAQQKEQAAIVMRYRPKIQAIISDQKLTNQQKQDKIKSLIQQANSSLTALLTPTQRAANEKLRKQAVARQAQMQQAFNGRQAEMKKMQADFLKTLTPDQKKKLTALAAKARKDITQLIADKSLTPEQKQAKYQAMGQSYQTEAQKIYTPSQWAMLQKMRQTASSPLLPGGH